MANIIPAKTLTPNEVSEITKLTKDDITSDKLKDLFAVFYGSDEPKFQTYDMFILTKGKFFNSATIKTTVGRYIFNLFAMPECYLKKYGYCDDPLTSDTLGGIEKKMGQMILNDEMTTKEYANYMDHAEWIGMNMSYYITPSLTKATILPIPEVIARRDELFAKYKDAIDNHDIDIANKIETELMKMATEKLEAEGDPSYDNYKCGVFKPGVAYKKGMIMIGAIENPQTKQLDILKSNYTDGLSTADYDKAAQLTVIGGYSRGVKTRTYGYETKKYNSALQNEVIEGEDDDDQDVDMGDSIGNLDCGTTKCLSITIPKELKNMFLYRFINEKGKLIELTPDVIDSYVGKTVLLRSPMYCKGDSICEHCAGTLFKRMQMKNVGLMASNLTGKLLNMSMKAMHDSTVKVDSIDIDSFINDKD
jgi:hypothetical protein